MNDNELKQLKSVFKSHPKIKLVYFFGSKATGKSGPLSDYDFAFYLNETDKKKIFELKAILMEKMSRVLKTDEVDVVILNLAESPELKYNIIKDGKLIFETKPFKLIVEPRILNEYFDFHNILLRHGLTRA